MRGGGGTLRGLSQWVKLYTGAQINFGDLTPYLTIFNWTSAVDTVQKKNPNFKYFIFLLELYEGHLFFSIGSGHIMQCQ